MYPVYTQDKRIGGGSLRIEKPVWVSCLPTSSFLCERERDIEKERECVWGSD